MAVNSAFFMDPRIAQQLGITAIKGVRYAKLYSPEAIRRIQELIKSGARLKSGSYTVLRKGQKIIGFKKK